MAAAQRGRPSPPAAQAKRRRRSGTALQACRRKHSTCRAAREVQAPLNRRPEAAALSDGTMNPVYKQACALAALGHKGTMRGWVRKGPSRILNRHSPAENCTHKASTWHAQHWP